MNYLFNGGVNNAIFGIGADDLRIEHTTYLADTETGEEAKTYPNEVGKTYIVKECFAIKKAYSIVAKFDTEEEAKAKLKEILDELKSAGNKVIEI